MKAEAPENIESISVTVAVFQPLISWLKTPVFWNISSIFFTAPVFQSPIE